MRSAISGGNASRSSDESAVTLESIETFEIFPWTPDFATGIASVDEQHKNLVRLLNQLARDLILRADSFSTAEILCELGEYTVYHFQCEEQLMRDVFAGDILEIGHRQAHQEFVQSIDHIKKQGEEQSGRQTIEEIVAFLGRWLAYHILDTDRRMAIVILAVQRGVPLEEARVSADREMSGAVKVLIDAALGMYEKLSSRTFQLLKEIIERKNAEIQLRRAATVLSNALEAIFASDSQHLMIDANAAFCDMTGQNLTALAGRRLEDVLESLDQEDLWPHIWQSVQAQGRWSGEIALRAGSGEPSASWMSLSAVTDDTGNTSHYVGVLTNITQLIAHQKQLERVAFHDALTGLPNRLFLSEHMRQAIAGARRQREFLAVCYLDLDGFKAVNDAFGHAAGDQVLQEVAARCQVVLRSNDTMARIGGDEFVILLGDLRHPSNCNGLLDRLLAEVRRPIALGDQQVCVTVSIGVALFPNDDADPETLLHYADLAMYQAKQSGKGQYRFR